MITPSTSTSRPPIRCAEFYCVLRGEKGEVSTVLESAVAIPMRIVASGVCNVAGRGREESEVILMITAWEHAL